MKKEENQKHLTNLKIISATTLGVFMIVGVSGGTILAAENNADGPSYKESSKEGLGKHHKRHRLGGILLTQEERQQLREGFKDLDEDERQDIKNILKEFREDRKDQFEDFTGLTRDEIKELRKNGESVGEVIVDGGRSESDIKDFLEDQANDHIDIIVDLHDLDDDFEDTLRDRVDDFVDKVFEKLFSVRE